MYWIIIKWRKKQTNVWMLEPHPRNSGAGETLAKLIRRFCWTHNLKHFNRILIVTFFYINGLDPKMFMEWVNLLNLWVTGPPKTTTQPYTRCSGMGTTCITICMAGTFLMADTNIWMEIFAIMYTNMPENR